MKGLSQAGEEAFKEYLDRYEHEAEKSENPCKALAHSLVISVKLDGHNIILLVKQ